MSWVIFWFGIILETVLLWRLLAWRAWRAYPMFFCFFVFLVARLVLLELLLLYIPANSASHSLWYWFTSLFADVLKLFVAWEIYRRMLPRQGTANRVAGLLFGGTLLALAAFCLVAGIRSTNFFVEVGTDFEVSVAVLMVGALLITKYYGHPLNLNAWGIILGLGLFAAGSVMNFSALGIDERMYPIFRHARPLLFDITLLIWVFTLWSPASLPHDPSALRPEDQGPPGIGETPWGQTKNALGRALDRNAKQ